MDADQMYASYQIQSSKSYFEYRSLTPHQKRIRLVHVLPEEQRLTDNVSNQLPGVSDITDVDMPVSCTLSHVSLKDAPPYNALSYNWGDPARTRPILVNGAILNITENLDAALRHLRLPDMPLCLWIDALCIDQSDDIEKSEQIQQMREIYSKANSVIAWLGPAADDSDLAMQWIQKYGERAYELGIGTSPELQLRTVLETWEAQGKSLIDEGLSGFLADLILKLSPESTEQAHFMTGLTILLKRPYWSRVWVVQELISASTAVFVCGKETVSENALHHALRLLRNFRRYQILKMGHDKATVPFEGYSVISIETHDPVTLLKFRRANGPFPLIYLMRSLRQFKATDPRDKVFALLGISGDAEALGVRPDYRKTCEMVYTDLARTLLQNGYLELLSLCGLPRRVVDVSSWVPDWSLKNHCSPLQERSLDRSTRPLKTILEPEFSASGKGMISDQPHGDTITGKAPLLLHAAFLGTVGELGMIWKNGAFGTWLHDLQRLAQLVPGNLGLSGGGEQAVWRTSVADQEIRRGTKKPRLSKERIHSIHEALRNKDLSLMNAQTLADVGLGDYFEQLQTVAQGRRPLLASGGYLGIGPRETELGDHLVILLGAETPVLLRRYGEGGQLRLVGEAYVHGIMDGEAMEDLPTIDTISLY